MMVQISIEQQIRNILTDMEIEDAQKFTAGDLCELANILADKIKFEQELHMIDALLARRPALADFDTRIDRISYAIKVASQKDALEQRCRELEIKHYERDKLLQNLKELAEQVTDLEEDARRFPTLAEFENTKDDNERLKSENAELRKKINNGA